MLVLRRKWQPTPMFLPGESQGRGSLMGCCLWGRTESDNDWSDLAAAAAALGKVLRHCTKNMIYKRKINGLHYNLTKVCLVKAVVFPVVTYGRESWTIKEAEHRRIDAFELWCWRLGILLDCKEIQPVHPKGNQSWIFIRKTDAEAESPILWPPDMKNWFIGKDPDPGKDWRWEEKGTTEDEMIGWHHGLNGHEFE